MSPPFSSEIREILDEISEIPDFYGVVFEDINSTNLYGDNALHVVCSWNHFDYASKLIQSGINVNQIGELGHTPLHNAVTSADFKIIEILIHQKPFIRNCEFGSPIDFAIKENRDQNLVDLLVNYCRENPEKDLTDIPYQENWILRAQAKEIFFARLKSKRK